MTLLIFQLSLGSQTKRMKINRTSLNYIRFTDDTVILTDNLTDLQDILNKINNVGNSSDSQLTPTKQSHQQTAMQSGPNNSGQ